jgi:transposase
MIIEEGKAIFLRCGYTDMRKSIDGLSNIIATEYTLDPYDTALYIFCNKNRNRLKIIEWDGDGFWLHFKRLGKGHFIWPADDSDKLMPISRRELENMLAGTKLVRKFRRDELVELSAA